jgi:hypothetical protein
MKISLISLKNCLGIKELEFKPGKITLIDGTGKQGKTSIVESIQKTFTNTSERPEFVHSGSDKAEMYLVLDDGTNIKKYINKQGKVTTVNVEKDGIKYSSAETFLKGLINENQLNPINLINMDDKDLSEYILSLIPIVVTADDLEKWIDTVPDVNFNLHGLQVCKAVETFLYDKRTDINRTVRNLTVQVDDIKKKLPEKYDPEKWRNESLTEKYEEIRRANENNSKIKEQETIKNNLEQDIDELRVKCRVDITDVKEKFTNSKKFKEITISEKQNQIEKLKQEIVLLEKDLENIDSNCNKEIKDVEEKYINFANERKQKTKQAEEYLSKNKTIEIEPLEKEHKKIEDMKSYIRTADSLIEKQNELKKNEKEANNLSNKLEIIRSKPTELLSKAKMPVDGLSVSDDGVVLIDNRPIKNLSGTERIEFVLDVVRESAGELKIILINGFESLSPSDQEAFIKKCNGDEFEYIITRVTDGLLRILQIDENGTIVDNNTGEILKSIKR